MTHSEHEPIHESPATNAASTPDTYFFYHDMESGLSLSTTVAMGIAQMRDADPLDVHPELYEAVDPDALDALFQSAGSDGSPGGGKLTLPIDGLSVEIFDDGKIIVTRRE